jgi:hypothetical protein
VPLDPAYKAGLAGHVPVNANELRHAENEKIELNVKAIIQELSHDELP